VLDVASGKTLAVLPGNVESGMVFAFHASGRRLASCSLNSLCVWDLEQKKLIEEIGFPKPLPCDRLDWIDHDHLFVGGSFLIDLSRKIVLWQYLHQPSGPITILPDGTLCYVASEERSGRGIGRQSGLFFITVPHPEAIRVVAGLSADQLLAVKPGIQVGLDIRVSFTKPEEQRQVAEALAAKLKANGISPAASGAPIVLEATEEAGKPETKTYETRGFGQPGGRTQTVTVATKVLRLALKENGRVLWERTAKIGGAPEIVHFKEGQSLEGAIAEFQGSPAHFFLNVSLPRYVARHNEQGVFGRSMLTSEGVSGQAAP